jgi:hypothetical protein
MKDGMVYRGCLTTWKRTFFFSFFFFSPVSLHEAKVYNFLYSGVSRISLSFGVCPPGCLSSTFRIDKYFSSKMRAAFVINA